MAFDPSTAQLDSTFDPDTATESPAPGFKAGDYLKGLKRGVLAVPGALTGLADIPLALATGERVAGPVADALGRATGFQPSKWAKETGETFSPGAKAAQAKIEEAWKGSGADRLGNALLGNFDDLPEAWKEADLAGAGKAIVENPGASALQVVESLPAMLAGGAIGKGVAVASKLAPAIAGAIGEGAITAGQQMDQTDAAVDPRRAAATSATAGALTGAIAGGMGRVAQKLGLEDIQTTMAGGKANATGLGRAGRLAGGTASEALQEIPQSAQEQVWQNVAEEKPLGEGVVRSAVEGGIAGGVMGAGANLRRPGTPLPPPGATAPGDIAEMDTLNAGLTQAGNDYAGQLPPNAGLLEEKPLVVQNPTTGVVTEINRRGGPLEQAAALAVESGASEVAQNVDAGEVLFPYANPRAAQDYLGRQADPEMYDVVPHPRVEGRTAVVPKTGPARQAILDKRAAGAANEQAKLRGEQLKQDESPAPTEITESIAGAFGNGSAGNVTITPQRGGGFEIRVSSSDGATKRSSVAGFPAGTNRAKAIAAATRSHGGFTKDKPVAKAKPVADTTVEDAAQDELAPPTVQPVTDMPGVQQRAKAQAQGAVAKAQTRAAQLADEETVDTQAQAANPEPSEAQKAAGNYAHGHIRVGGLDISVETPAGATRTGMDKGKPWKVKNTAHYGYVKRSKGADGEQVDVYVKPGTSSTSEGPVFVVDQYNLNTGAFDEHKALLGYGNQAEAAAAYDAHFSDKTGPKRRGAVTPMSLAAFKGWLADGDTSKAVAGKRFGKAVADNEQAAQDEIARSTGKMSLPRSAQKPGESDAAFELRRAAVTQAAKTARVAGQQALPTKDSDKAGVREALGMPDDAEVSILSAESRPDAGPAKGVSKQAAQFVQQVARTFGKRVVFFDVPDRGAAEGFYVRGNTIYLNTNSATQHLRVLGHELTHAMKRQARDSYEKMLGAVATLRTDEEMAAQFNDYFGRPLDDVTLLDQPHPGSDGTLREFLAEEWMADLGGNRFAESEFWTSVFGRLEGQHGTEAAKGVVARLRLALVAALNKLKTLIGGNAFAVDARLGEHLEGIRTAVAEGFAEYARLSKAGQLADVAGEAKFAPAWHGTPHVWEPEPGFPHGRPRLDKLGTGEGAQAYGWGWYSAEVPKVAESYKQAPGAAFKVDGKTYAQLQNIWFDLPKPERRAITALADSAGNSQEALVNLAAQITPESKQAATLLAGWIDEGKVETYEGNLYHLDIPDEVMPHLLDWDKPLREQPASVRKALGEVPLINGYGNDFSADNPTGGEAYQAWTTRRNFGTAKAASEYLASIGIPGLRYLDGDSRNRPPLTLSPVKGIGRKTRWEVKGLHFPAEFSTRAGAEKFMAQQGAATLPTSNFVIWDQPTLDKVALLKRNGEALDAIRAAFSPRRPGSDLGHKRESDGRYVGAPEWVGNSPQQLAVLRKKLLQLTLEGEPGRFWYEQSSKAILDLAKGDKEEAEKIVQLIAVYSPSAQVPGNTTMALKAYYQWKQGLPVRVGFGQADRKASALLYEGKEWKGMKTNTFYSNLMEEIDPSKNLDGATMDMWMAIAFDYGSRVLDQGPKYKFAERETQRIAKRLGWSPHQVQAAIWTAMKGRVDPIRGVLTAQELDNGWYDEESQAWWASGEKAKYESRRDAALRDRAAGKRTPFARVDVGTEKLQPARRKDHYHLAHKLGMEYNLTQEDVMASKYDFSNAIRERTAQMSWEATPGETTGVLPGIHKAPMHQQQEYLVAIRKALSDEKGNDLIGKEVGLALAASVQGFSGWQGVSTVGIQDGVAVPIDTQTAAVQQMAIDAINLVADIKGLVLYQEGVAWHFPNYKGSKNGQNGVEFRIGRLLTEEENANLYKGLVAALGHTYAPPIPTQDGQGFRVLNFPDEKFALMDDFGKSPEEQKRKKDLQKTQLEKNVAFIESVMDVVYDQPWHAEVTGNKRFESIGDLRQNDWSKGDAEYRGRIEEAQSRWPTTANRWAGRSNLLGWIEHDLRPRVAEVNRDFSERYGWGKASLSPQRGVAGPDAAGNRQLGGDGQAGLRRQVQPESVSAVGVHYSKQQRERLDSSYFGTGIPGAEVERVADATDPRIKQRIYFYVNNGRPIKPEEGVGSHAHQAQLDNLYDYANDPLDLRVTNTFSGFESALLDKGFDGAINIERGIAVLLGQRNLAVEYIGQNDRPDVPQAAQAEPSTFGKQMRAVAANRGLPSGEMTGADWKRLMPKLMPDIDVSHLNDEQKYYKDEVVNRPQALAKMSPQREGLPEGFRVESNPISEGRKFIVTDANGVRLGSGETREEAIARFKEVHAALYPAVPESPAAPSTLDGARLKALRRTAAGLETPQRGVFLRVTDDGKVIASGPKGARIPDAFRRFAHDNGLSFYAERKGYAQASAKPMYAGGRTSGDGYRGIPYASIAGVSEPIPIAYRESGALYFGEMGSAGLDRTDKTRFSTQRLAPNGKPSKLDERQWQQVRTPEFKAWFGDWEAAHNGKDGNGVWARDDVSKVVDENGEPLVVYHGTERGGFTTFRPDKADRQRSPMIFAAATRETARTYAGRGTEIDLDQSDPLAGYRVAKSDSPAHAQHPWRVVDKAGKTTDDHIAFRSEAMAQKWLDEEREDAESGEQVGVYSLFLNLRNPNEADFEGANWDGVAPYGMYEVIDDNDESFYSSQGELFMDIVTARIVAERHGLSDEAIRPAQDRYETTNTVAEEAKRYGKDGAIIRRTLDDGGNSGRPADVDDVFVVFDANQLKSAVGNTGTFSTKNDDIRYNPQRTVNIDGVDRPTKNSKGKPIAQDEEGLRNFWRWFGDSKAVEAVNVDTGKPVESSREPRLLVPSVLYHTTRRDVAVFEAGRETRNSGTFGDWDVRRHAIFATPDLGASQEYGKVNGLVAKGANTLPLYAKAERPLDLTEGVSEEAEEKLVGAGMSPRAVIHLGRWDMFDDENGSAFVNAAKAAGYDSVIFNDENPETGEAFEAWALFDANQLKSAVGNTGTFSTENDDIRYSPPRFFSQLQRTFESAPAKLQTQPAAQWKLWLAGQQAVKKDEIAWSGINDWLDLQGKAKVSRAQIQEYLAHNGVQLKDVVLGEDLRELTHVEWAQKNFPDVYRQLIEAKEKGNEEDATFFNHVLTQQFQLGMGVKVDGDTKFDQYVLPGGQNYRELLITLPDATSYSLAERKKLARLDSERQLTAAEQARYAELQRETKGKKAKFKSDHFDEPNILAHVRFNERIDTDGNKVLFLEELQSDWGQQGKRKGFGPPPLSYYLVSPTGHRMRDYPSAEEAKDAAEAMSFPGGTYTWEHGTPHRPYVEPGPFVTDTKAWTALALKRAILWAAQNGFSKVAWTTGEQQTERYDLSKHVGYITLDRGYPEGYSVTAYSDDAAADEILQKDVKTPEELADVIGKDAADKLLRDMGPGTHGELARPDIKVGGEGMSAYYDSIVPQVANDLLRKVGGGKVETVEVAKNGREGKSVRQIDRPGMKTRGDLFEQPGFTITPVMTAKVAGEGLPLFSPVRANLGALSPAQAAAANNVLGTPKTFMERLAEFRKDWAKNLKQGIFDQFAPIAELDQQAYIQARLSKGGESTLEALMLYGKLFVGADGATDVRYARAAGKQGFAGKMAALKGEHDRFLLWVAAQRADRLQAIGLENLWTPNDIVTLKGLDQGAMKDGTARPALYAQALQDLNAFNDNVLDVAVSSGLIDDATRQMYAGTPYVPFYRLQEDDTVTGFGIKPGLVNQYAWKKLKGGTQKLNEDLLANLLHNWSHLITASAKNRAAKATLDAAATAGIAAQVPAGMLGKGHVSYKAAGQEQVFVVSDPHLFDAVAALHYAGLGPWAKPLAAAKHWLTIGVTANPAFKVRNLIRDSIGALGAAQLSYNVAGNLQQGWQATAEDNETRAHLLASGGMIRFGSMLDGKDSQRAADLIHEGVDPAMILDSDAKIKKFWRRYVHPALSAYNEFGDRTENINRAALYEQLIAKGLTNAEAAYWSRDLMDFAMAGKWTAIRTLTQTVPFFNARLQGLYKLGRAGKQDIRRLGTVLGAVSLSSLALLLAYGDDDDWKKRSDSDRNNYWWFRVGGHAFRLPKPFEIGAVGTLAERGYELMFEKEMTDARFGRNMRDIVMSQLSMNPVPQLFKPMMDIYANKDAFTGQAIESMGMERLRKEDRYDERTSEVARFLGGLGLPDPTQLVMGRWDTLSPKQVDFLARGYFSWLGTMTTTALDYGIRPMLDRGVRSEMQLKDMFFAGNFVESLPSNQSRYLTQLYDQAREIEQAYASYHHLLKLGDLEGAKEIREKEGSLIKRYPATQQLKRAESLLDQQLQRINASTTLSSEEKRVRLDQVYARRNTLAERFQAQ